MDTQPNLRQQVADIGTALNMLHDRMWGIRRLLSSAHSDCNVKLVFDDEIEHYHLEIRARINMKLPDRPDFLPVEPGENTRG
jgi:hypothetical protein